MGRKLPSNVIACVFTMEAPILAGYTAVQNIDSHFPLQLDVTTGGKGT